MDLDIYLECMKNHSKYYALKIMTDAPKGLNDGCCDYIDINGVFEPKRHDLADKALDIDVRP